VSTLSESTRVRKRAALARARGITAAVPADRATRYIQRLMRAGMPPLDIARTAGLGDKTITQLAAGRYEKIYRTTETAVLRVPFPGPGYQPVHDGRIDATGARRRLQALSALGFPLTSLAVEIGTTTRTVCDIRRGDRRWLHTSLDQDIRAAYDRLWNQDPASCGVTSGSATRARKWAARNAWALPAEWDDDDIDEPTATPHNQATSSSVREVAAARAADIQHLGRFGLSTAEIAARVGVSEAYVRAQLGGYRAPGQPSTRQEAA